MVIFRDNWYRRIGRTYLCEVTASEIVGLTGKRKGRSVNFCIEWLHIFTQKETKR